MVQTPPKRQVSLAVERHPQRAEIEAAILKGQTDREISAWTNPRLSHLAIWKFRKKRIKPALDGAGALAKALSDKGLLREDANVEKVAGTLTEGALALDPFIARIQKHEQVLDKAIQRTGDVSDDDRFDARALAALVSADVKRSELWARLAGRLDGPQAQSHSIVVIMPQSAVSAGPAQRQIEPADVVDCQVVEGPDRT